MKTESEINKSKLQELQQWFHENPNLPQEIDNILLRRFLKCTHGNVENTKKLLESNFSLRNKHPHIFMDQRDIDDENVKEVIDTHDIVILPGLTPERHKLVISRLVDSDPKKVNSIREAKFIIMLSDCRLTMTDDDHDVDAGDVEDEEDDEDDDDNKCVDKCNVNTDDQLADGDVQIIDMAGYTMSHATRISLSVFRINMHYLQEAYPVRLCAMHVINCPSFLNKMMTIFRPFIHEDVYQMIHFHSDGLDSLYQHVPRDMLPYEYGGKAGKMNDIKMKWIRVLKEKRNYLMDSKQWKIQNYTNNSKRSWLWW